MSEVLVLTVIEADYQWDDKELVVKASDYDQLKAELDRLRDVQILLNTERAFVEQLEERLDEARELLAVASEIIHEQAIHIDRPMTDLGSEALTRLDDWMEENKI